MTTVAVVEDHPLYRQGLLSVLEQCPDVGAVTGAGSLEVLEAGGEVWDVVILDLHLPGCSGAEAVRRLRAAGCRVLVLSASGGEDDVVSAIASGAAGYLTKDADAEEVLDAMRTVAEDGTYTSPVLAGYLLEAAHRRPDHLPLTPREQEILRLVAEGETDREIADQLFISVRTVRSHLDRIRGKTGRRRRPDLTRLALEAGMARKYRQG